MTRNYWDYPGPGDMPHPQDDDLDSWREPDDFEAEILDNMDPMDDEEDDDDDQDETTATA